MIPFFGAKINTSAHNNIWWANHFFVRDSHNFYFPLLAGGPGGGLGAKKPGRGAKSCAFCNPAGRQGRGRKSGPAPHIFLAICGEIGYNSPRKYKMRQAGRCWRTYQPCTSASTTQHSKIHCTTGLLYPFPISIARGYLNRAVRKH